MGETLSVMAFPTIPLSPFSYISAQELLGPALEDHQGEELVRVVASAREVLTHAPLDRGPLQEAAGLDALSREERLHQGPELASEPVLHGNAEPLFAPVQDPRGKLVRHRLLQDVLPPVAPELQRAGHAERELDDVLVEKRRSRLERRRHAHPVHLDEDIVGEEELEVRVELSVEEIVSLLTEGRDHRSGGGKTREGLAQPLRVELRLLLGGKVGEPPVVLERSRSRSSREEALHLVYHPLFFFALWEPFARAPEHSEAPRGGGARGGP